MRRSFDHGQRSTIELYAALRERGAPGFFFREALDIAGPAIAAAGPLTARLDVDGKKGRAGAYSKKKVLERAGAAGSSVGFSLYSEEGESFGLDLTDNTRVAYARMNAGAPRADRGAVARIGETFSEILAALAAQFDLCVGYAHWAADGAAHYARHSRLGAPTPEQFSQESALRPSRELAWRHALSREAAAKARASLPEGLSRTLPNGAAIAAFPGDFDRIGAPETLALRAAAGRAIDPSAGPELDEELSARARVLAPVEVDWDDDLDDLLTAWVEETKYPYSHARALQWAARRAEPRWRFARGRGDVAAAAAPALFEPLGAEALSMLHRDLLPGLDPPRSEKLADIDRAAIKGFLNRIGRLSMFAADVERHLRPALGIYLGEVLVRELGGAWVIPAEADLPRDPAIEHDWPVARVRPETLCEVAVEVGRVAFFPFDQARRLVAGQGGDKADSLEGSFTKLFRTARRFRDAPPAEAPRDGVAEGPGSAAVAGGDPALSSMAVAASGPDPALSNTAVAAASSTAVARASGPAPAAPGAAVAPRKVPVVYAIAEAPSGRTAIATWDDVTVLASVSEALSADRGEPVCSCTTTMTEVLDFVTDDLLASARHGHLHLWDSKSGYPRRVYPTGGSRKVNAVVSRGPERIAFATEAGRVGLVDASSDGVRVLRESGASIPAIALSPDGGRLFVGLKSAVVAYDTATLAEAGKWYVAKAHVLAFASDADELAFVVESGRAGVLSLSARAERPLGAIKGTALRLFAMPAGWVAVTRDAAFVLGQGPPRRVALPPPAPRAPRAAAWSPSLQRLLVGTAAGIEAIAL